MMKNLIQMELEEMKEIDEDDLMGPNNLERVIIEDIKSPSVWFFHSLLFNHFTVRYLFSVRIFNF